jgi:hypothetical protein
LKEGGRVSVMSVAVISLTLKQAYQEKRGRKGGTLCRLRQGNAFLNSEI